MGEDKGSKAPCGCWQTTIVDQAPDGTVTERVAVTHFADCRDGLFQPYPIPRTFSIEHMVIDGATMWLGKITDKRAPCGCPVYLFDSKDGVAVTPSETVVHEGMCRQLRGLATRGETTDTPPGTIPSVHVTEPIIRRSYHAPEPMIRGHQSVEDEAEAFVEHCRRHVPIPGEPARVTDDDVVRALLVLNGWETSEAMMDGARNMIRFGDTFAVRLRAVLEADRQGRVA